jgi:uncharacterized protein
MGFSIFPKNEVFFDLFTKSASNIRVAADCFLDMVHDYTHAEDKSERLKHLESLGDSITHDIIDRLNASFITPIDREDIFGLAGNLDDVLDEIEGVGNRMLLFAIDRPTPACIELAQLIVQGARAIECAITNLRRFSGIQDHLIEINSVENKVDEITRKMVGELFHQEAGDVVDLIKWKEIYARLEHTADRMEDVANVIEDIVVKHA